jgi:hypothetical protein
LPRSRDFPESQSVVFGGDLMVHQGVSGKDPEVDAVVSPAYTQRLDLEPIPKYRMPERGAAPEVFTG